MGSLIDKSAEMLERQVTECEGTGAVFVDTYIPGSQRILAAHITTLMGENVIVFDERFFQRCESELYSSMTIGYHWTTQEENRFKCRMKNMFDTYCELMLYHSCLFVRVARL